MNDLRRFTEAWPGDHLAFRVTGSTSRDWFFESGRRSVQDVEAVLAVVRRPLQSFTSILDFGCGCGRMLVWLGNLAKTTAVHGVDIDEQAVEWAQHHLAYATVKVNQPLPPLDYADDFFDLVYNHSVFSHIDEDLQDLWLAELRRVTRPGGWLVISVHGEHAFDEFERTAGEAGFIQGELRNRGLSLVRRQMQDRGIAHIREDSWGATGLFPDFFHTTFHAPWYVFAHWSRWFRIRAYVPRGSLDYQDFVLLERLPDDHPRPEPLAPSAVTDNASPSG